MIVDIIIYSFRILCLSKHLQSQLVNLMKKVVSQLKKKFVIFLSSPVIYALILMIVIREFLSLSVSSSIHFVLFVSMTCSRISHILKNARHVEFICAKTLLLWTKPCLEYVIECPYSFMLNYKRIEKEVGLSKNLCRQRTKFKDWSISQKTKKSRTSILIIENKKEFFQNYLRLKTSKAFLRSMLEDFLLVKELPQYANKRLMIKKKVNHFVTISGQLSNDPELLYI